MDIAAYIQSLLWEYECVIVPGFGGILATYRPAEMVLAEHTIYPPMKALAFNEHLVHTDGLLITHICNTEAISYIEATEKVATWVSKTKALLAANEEIYLPKIGRFHKDVEKQLRFEPEAGLNYLASAYGLRKVIAEPVLRSKSADTIEVLPLHRASYALPRNNTQWAMAAVVLLLLALGITLNLMYQGVNIRPLDLNAASVLGFLDNFNETKETAPELKPSPNKELPAFTNTTLESAASKSTETVINEIPAVESGVTEKENSPAAETAATTATLSPLPKATSTPTGKKYYVIIGAFKRRANFKNAEAYLRATHAPNDLYEDTSLEKKRIGFYAGDNYEQAYATLTEARKDKQEYWLLKK